jgi:hypothetical protein
MLASRLTMTLLSNTATWLARSSGEHSTLCLNIKWDKTICVEKVEVSHMSLPAKTFYGPIHMMVGDTLKVSYGKESDDRLNEIRAVGSLIRLPSPLFRLLTVLASRLDELATCSQTQFRSPS